MIYAYIDEQRVNVSVVRLCHALGESAPAQKLAPS